MVFRQISWDWFSVSENGSCGPCGFTLQPQVALKKLRRDLMVACLLRSKKGRLRGRLILEELVGSLARFLRQRDLQPDRKQAEGLCGAVQSLPDVITWCCPLLSLVRDRLKPEHQRALVWSL